MKKRRLARENRRLALELDMANGCLDMIRETMEDLSGEDAKRDGICAMFYPEWIQATLAKKLAESQGHQWATSSLTKRTP